MTTINFPNSPSIGDQYAFSGKIWQWDGTGWFAVRVPGGTGATGSAGNDGIDGQVGATGPTGLGITTVTWASTMSVVATSLGIFDITMTGNATLNLSGGADGQPMAFRIRQDGSGTRVLTLGSMFRGSTDLTLASVVLSTTPFYLDYLGIRYNQADNKYDVTALNRGYH